MEVGFGKGFGVAKLLLGFCGLEEEGVWFLSDFWWGFYVRRRVMGVVFGWL